MILSMVGLVAGLLLLIYFALRGMNLFIAGPICAVIVALSGDITIFETVGTDNFVKGYMDGFSSFIRAWFFMFLLGSIFGKLMEGTGAADSLAHWVVDKLGRGRAALAVVTACAVLTYGGVSVFIVAFSVYPMALSLFHDANIPHRLIPAALALGSVTFTMTSAGSPEIQNWIPTKFLGTTPYAAWEVSLVVAIFMAVAGYTWLQLIIKRAQARGEGFGSQMTYSAAETAACKKNMSLLTEKELSKLSDRSVTSTCSLEATELPHPITGLIPLLMVLATSFVTHKTLQENALIVALLAGCLTLAAINYKFIRNPSGILSEGTYGALLAIGNTSAVVGFGAVAKLSPAFVMVVDAMTSMEGNALIGAAIAITTVAGLTGSASGGQTIALPELAPHYLESGVDPEHLHRITAISSGALDSLPHNGYVVTTIRVICGETHKSAYVPVALLTIVIPLIGTALAILLMTLGL